MRSFTLKVLVLPAFGGVIGAPAALAQSSDEVVVVGARTAGDVALGVLGAIPISQIPASVTGYTDAMILDQGARTTSEVLANDPSIRVQGAGDGNYDFFSIRGFSVSAAVYSLEGLYGVMPWNTLSPEAVERFELIRGPSTTFTGASPLDSPGGSVNIRAKRAGDRPLTSLTATLDAAGEPGIHADISRRFGADDEWGVRVNAMRRSGDLARSHQSEDITVAALGADYRGERLRASFDIGHQDYRTDGATYLFYIPEGTPVPNAPETDRNVSPEWAFADSSDSYVAARIEADVRDNVMVFVAAGSRDHESSILNPYTEILDGEGSLSVYPYEEAYFADTKWSASAGVSFTFETGRVAHHFVASASGVDFDNGWRGTYDEGFSALPEYESNLYVPFYPAAPDLTGVPTSGALQLENRLVGLSLLDSISIDDGRYTVLVGLRKQKFDIIRLYDADAPNYRESTWAPSLGALMRVGENASLYANYLVGLSQGPFAPVGTENQNQQFPPSETRQYEVGMKWQLRGLFTSLALFQITQPAGLIDPNTNFFNVSGKQRHRGIEWTFAGDVGRNARLLGGVNYIDAELLRTEGARFDGNRAPGVPEFTANLGGEIDLAALDGLTLTGRALYTSNEYIFADNLQRVPGWTRLDIGARYRIDTGRSAITLRLNVTNATGKDYWASAKGSGLTIGAPRSAYFSATFDF